MPGTIEVDSLEGLVELTARVRNNDVEITEITLLLTTDTAFQAGMIHLAAALCKNIHVRSLCIAPLEHERFTFPPMIRRAALIALLEMLEQNQSIQSLSLLCLLFHEEHLQYQHYHSILRRHLDSMGIEVAHLFGKIIGEQPGKLGEPPTPAKNHTLRRLVLLDSLGIGIKILAAYAKIKKTTLTELDFIPYLDPYWRAYCPMRKSKDSPGFNQDNRMVMGQQINHYLQTKFILEESLSAAERNELRRIWSSHLQEIFDKCKSEESPAFKRVVAEILQSIMPVDKPKNLSMDIFSCSKPANLILDYFFRISSSGEIVNLILSYASFKPPYETIKLPEMPLRSEEQWLLYEENVETQSNDSQAEDAVVIDTFDLKTQTEEEISNVKRNFDWEIFLAIERMAHLRFCMSYARKALENSFFREARMDSRERLNQSCIAYRSATLNLQDEERPLTPDCVGVEWRWAMARASNLPLPMRYVIEGLEESYRESLPMKTLNFVGQKAVEATRSVVDAVSPMLQDARAAIASAYAVVAQGIELLREKKPAAHSSSADQESSEAAPGEYSRLLPPPEYSISTDRRDFAAVSEPLPKKECSVPDFVKTEYKKQYHPTQFLREDSERVEEVVREEVLPQIVDVESDSDECQFYGAESKNQGEVKGVTEAQQSSQEKDVEDAVQQPEVSPEKPFVNWGEAVANIAAEFAQNHWSRDLSLRHPQSGPLLILYNPSNFSWASDQQLIQRETQWAVHGARAVLEASDAASTSAFSATSSSSSSSSLSLPCSSGPASASHSVSTLSL